MRRPIASTVYRLADSHVLIGVKQTPEGPQPLFTQVSGELAAVAYTDVDEARSDLPEDYRLFSIQVADLLSQLPPQAGVVVDPRAPSPVHVAAADRDAVVAAARAFPAGAPVRIGDPADEPEALTAAVTADAAERPWLRRLWRTWYQAADADPKLLVVYEVDDAAENGVAAGDLVFDAARRTDYPTEVLVMAVQDLPAEHREWLLNSTPPFYARP